MKIKKKQIIDNKNKIYSIDFINDNGFKFSFLNLGCYIKNIIIPYPNSKKSEDVILGYSNLKDIKNNKSYFNTTIGRVAGRISNSSFNLDNKKYYLINNDNKHHLHGGNEGFNKKIWNIIKLDKNNNSATCSMVHNSLNLEEGYPGNLKCCVKYKFDNKNQITISFKAFSDKNTIINLTNHNYWNFNGHSSHHNNISNHFISINSNKYCEVNNELIPTGKILNVQKTKFDFKKFKQLNSKILDNNSVDNYYLQNNKINKIVEVFSPSTRMGMVLSSDQPGVQFYTGSNMENKYNGKNGKFYGKQYGICFEPQEYPNAINIKKFPNIILKKGDVYKSTIKFLLKNNY